MVAVDKKQLGSDLLKALGGNNGIDTKNLTDKLVKAQRLTDMNPLDDKIKQLDSKLKAWGRVRTAMDSFKSEMSKIKNNSDGFRYGIKSSNAKALDVKIADGVSLTTPVSHSVSVTSLATGQTLRSPEFTKGQKNIGTGKLTFDFGNWSGNTFAKNEKMKSFTIDVNSTNNSLKGIRDAINKKMEIRKEGDADAPTVTASVVVSNGKEILILKTPTGDKSSLRISVEENNGSSNDNKGLSALAYNPTQKSMTETATATNAKYSFDGVPMESQTNKIKGVIDGVDITLKGRANGIALTGGFDLNRAELAIKAFVDSFNKLTRVIQAETKIDISDKKAEDKENGALSSESSLTLMQSQLVNMVGKEFTGTSGKKFTLATMGIVTNRKGEMEYMSLKEGRLIVDQDDKDVMSNLKDFLKDNIRDVGSIFTSMQAVTDPSVKLVRSASAKPGKYPVEITKRAEAGYIEGHTVSLSDDKPLSVTGGRSANGILKGLKVSDFDSLTVTDDNNKFQVKINGVLSGELELTKKRYTSLKAMATELENVINASSALSAGNNKVDVTVSSGGYLQIKSRQTGEESDVRLISMNYTVQTAIGLSELPPKVTGTDAKAIKTTAYAASLQGKYATATFPLVLSPAQNSFKFKINGVSQSTAFSLNVPPNGFRNLDEFAKALEDKANEHNRSNGTDGRISVTAENNRLVIKSKKAGAGSSIAIETMDGSLRNKLGLAVGDATYTAGALRATSKSLTSFPMVVAVPQFSVKITRDNPSNPSVQTAINLSNVRLNVPSGGYADINDYAADLQRAIKNGLTGKGWSENPSVTVVGDKLHISINSTVGGGSAYPLKLDFSATGTDTLETMGLLAQKASAAKLYTKSVPDKFPAMPAAITGHPVEYTKDKMDFNNEDLQFTVDGIQTDTFKIPAGDHNHGPDTAKVLEDKINAELKKKINSDPSLKGRDVRVKIHFWYIPDDDGNPTDEGRYNIQTVSKGGSSSITIDKMSSTVRDDTGLGQGVQMKGTDPSSTISIANQYVIDPLAVRINGKVIFVPMPKTTGLDRAGIAAKLQKEIRDSADGVIPDKNVTVRWNAQDKRYVFTTPNKGKDAEIEFLAVQDERLKAILGLEPVDSTPGASAKTIKVEVDGVESGNIRLPMGKHTKGGSFAAALQQAINADALLSGSGKSVSVFYENSRLRIVSNSVGADSRAAVTGGETDILKQLGFDEATPSVYGADGVPMKYDTKGYLQGTKIVPTPAEIKVGFGEQAFRIKVDGVQSGALQLPLLVANSETPEQFARTLQSKINADPTLRTAGKSVQVKWQDGRYTFTSDKAGKTSSVDITSMANTMRVKLGLSDPTKVQGTDLVPARFASSAAMVSNKLDATEPATSAKLTLGPIDLSDGKSVTVKGDARTIQLKVNDNKITVQLDEGPFTSMGTLSSMIKDKVNSALSSAGHSDRIDVEVDGDKIVLTSKAKGEKSRLELHDVKSGASAYGLKLQDGFTSDVLNIGETVDGEKKKIEIKSGENQITLSHKGTTIGPATITAGEYESGADLAKAINDSLTGKTAGGRSVTVTWNESSKKLVWKLSGTGSDSQLSLTSMTYSLREKLGMKNTPEYHGRAESAMKEKWEMPSDLSAFSISVDGIASGDLTLPQKTYTSPTTMASDLQTLINNASALKSASKKVRVTWNGENGRFNIISESKGKNSSLSITKIDSRMADKFGFFTPQSVYGKNIEGKINNVEATGEGRNLTLSNEDNDANSISVDVEDSSKDKFDVVITKGLPSDLEDEAKDLTKKDKSSAGAKGVTTDDGLITINEKELDSEKKDINKQKETVEERLTALRKRYEHQFNAMHKSLSSLKNSEKTIKGFVDSQKPRDN